MFYFLVLYLFYILSGIPITIQQKDSKFTKKIKTLARLFVIMFMILNFYGYCVSNVIYSCVLIYIISYLKNDEIKEFLDTFNFYKQENFQSENSNKIFRRQVPEMKTGGRVQQQYVIDASQFNNLGDYDNEYDSFELAAIKHQLENRLWITSDNSLPMINIEDKLKLEQKKIETEEEEEELLLPAKNILYYIKKFFAFLLSLVGL